MKRRDFLLVTGVILPTLLVGCFGAFMIAFTGYAVEAGLNDEFPHALTLLGFVTEGVGLVSAVVLALHYREHRRLERALDRERDFAALIAHQLRQRFTALNWAMDASEDKTLDATSRAKALEDLRQITDQGERTVNALLRASRLERGAVRLHTEDVHARTVAEEAITLLRGRAAERQAVIRIDIPDACTIRADRELAAEAVRNVVDNAIVHGGGDNVITIGCAVGQNGENVLTIADHGPGIPKEAHPHVFQKSIAQNAAVKGAGIGLYITKTLMELMGGDADFESSPQGTTFTLSFPAAPAR